ncbi:MAG: peptide deformylase [Pseudomonadota bacterium]
MIAGITNLGGSLMAILKIARMGNPVLLEKAKSVEDIEAENIARLIDDMRDTLDDIGANGLAAPQVHVGKRVVLYRITPAQIPQGAELEPIGWTPLINPVIEPLSDDKKPIWERCLSVPGLHGQVERHTLIRLTALNLDGSSLVIIASGFHAMLLQHECDHLDGLLYPMRMTDLSTLAFNSELGEKGFMVPRSLDEFRTVEAQT